MNDLTAELIKGTEFESMTDDCSGLSAGSRVKTPLEILNAFLGGGLPFGSIVEIFGPNAGGKSTLTYQTVANFMDDYEDGIVLLLDAEATTDRGRLMALGVKNPDRIIRLKISCLEQGFEQITTVLKKLDDNPKLKDAKVMIVWDRHLSPYIRKSVC